MEICKILTGKESLNLKTFFPAAVPIAITFKLGTDRRFLANVNFRYMLSPVRLSVVCLSSVCLSVCRR